MPIDILLLKNKLSLIGEEHLLHYWDLLSENSQDKLARQIHNLDVPTILSQKQLIKSPLAKVPPLTFEPFSQCETSGNLRNKKLGEKLLAEGKVGCLVVAGGQGTRLNMAGPKGMYPISVIKHKSLFQLLVEKAKASGKQTGKIPPLAIMTSPLNHEQTLAFFKQHDNFGLSPEHIFFYPQEMLPFLNQQGTLFLEKLDQIAMGPNGNGMSLTSFVQNGIWQRWSEKGIEFLNYVLIDNPLTDPFDAELIGFHATSPSEITIKCIARQQADEKVGILVNETGKAKVIEYTEFPLEEREARLPDGHFKHRYANISLFCFSMNFIRQATTSQTKLPLHANLKTASSLSRENHRISSQKIQAWKFETFIFDLLPYAQHLRALVYPREECFSPLKNETGEASPTSVRASLQAQDRRILESITHLPSPVIPFELSQEFHYPTPQLLAAWYQRIPQPNSNPYLEP
ncbi:MAG: hypothetical protein CK425_05315 [Parachlamydia sp.]|nr:MAG: hypothetical protein CK425_05315 [Parachlamydia sp.]